MYTSEYGVGLITNIENTRFRYGCLWVNVRETGICFCLSNFCTQACNPNLRRSIARAVIISFGIRKGGDGAG